MKNILCPLVRSSLFSITQAQEVISGCTAVWADNYDELATVDDETCYRYGCMLDWADNYDAYATRSNYLIPEPFYGNTGVNMTVFLSHPFINSLNVTDQGAYLVALDSNGMVVGSEVVAGVSQTMISVWGNDSSTQKLMALYQTFRVLSVGDGETLYDVIMPTPVLYISDSMVGQSSASIRTMGPNDCFRFGCT